MILSHIFVMEELFTFEKLNNAFYQCYKASHWKTSTQRYEANLFLNNAKLLEELITGKYRVSPTNNFYIRERGKERYIEAPVIRDRIVQKILCQDVLIPQLRPKLIYDNYASLENRGTTFARKRIDILLRRFIRKHHTGYALKIDIKKYFESINHEILKDIIHKSVKASEDVLKLINYIIDKSSHSDKGLNLGSEAPQIFAIFYLSRLDNYIKSVKGIKYYGRYMDDMIIFSESKEELKQLLEEIKNQLSELKLEINKNKTHIIKLSKGFTFMQIKYHIDNGKIVKRPTRSKITRERRRLKKYKNLYLKGKMTQHDIYNCYMSWRNALIKDCSCYRTIKTFDNIYESLWKGENLCLQ